MLTSDSRLVTLERALTLGFDEFLPKPILDQEEFVQRINDAMTRRRRSTAVELQLSLRWELSIFPVHILDVFIWVGDVTDFINGICLAPDL